MIGKTIKVNSNLIQINEQTGEIVDVHETGKILHLSYWRSSPFPNENEICYVHRENQFLHCYFNVKTKKTR